MATLTTPPVEAPETDHPPTAANEPSMEDILASIRRIIAEDQTNSLGRPGFGSFGRTTRSPDSARPAPAPVPSEDMANELASVPPTPFGPDLDGPGEIPMGAVETHRPDEPVLVEAAATTTLDPETRHSPPHTIFVAAESDGPHSEPEHTAEEQPLVSAAAGASINSSFHALAESMLLQDKAMVERLTRDELRPLLKGWLDDNLPSIVERLVRIEIERVARGGRARD